MTNTHPRRNRMTPYGTRESHPAHGTFLGNRGDIHKPDGSLSDRGWASPAWITCTTKERGTYRVAFDRKGTYTPLFFLDESVAFAAGHRPCAQCRRPAYKRFVAAWEAAHNLPTGSLRATQIDKVLHAARLNNRQHKTFESRFAALPEGVFFLQPETGVAARAEAGGGKPWAHNGYGVRFDVEPDTVVTVLTPEPVVAVLRHGYPLERDLD